MNSEFLSSGSLLLGSSRCCSGLTTLRRAPASWSCKDNPARRGRLWRRGQIRPTRHLPRSRLHAEFLDRRRDPTARAAYEKAPRRRGPALAGRQTGAPPPRGARPAAAAIAPPPNNTRRLRQAGDTRFTLAPAGQTIASLPLGIVEIPGPIRSFARMAALSPDLPPEDILLALARNVVTNGYQAVSGSEVAGADRIPEAGHPLPLAGARTRKAGRRRTRSSRSNRANRRRPATC